MITDEYLPQPFRFLNQIVRQVVEDSIDQASVRELSLTKIKRLRIPRDIVTVPLHIDQSVSLVSRGATDDLQQQNDENNSVLNDLLGADNNNDADNNDADGEHVAVANTTNKSGNKKQQNQTPPPTMSKEASASETKQLAAVRQLDPLHGLDFFSSPVVTATGSASAAIVINRQTGQFTAIDQSFPNEDEDENLSHQHHHQQQVSFEDDKNSNNSENDDKNNNQVVEGGEDEQRGMSMMNRKKENINLSPQHPTRTGSLPGTAGDVSQVFVDNGGAIDRERIIQSLAAIQSGNVNAASLLANVNNQQNNNNVNSNNNNTTAQGIVGSPTSPTSPSAIPTAQKTSNNKSGNGSSALDQITNTILRFNKNNAGNSANSSNNPYSFSFNPNSSTTSASGLLSASINPNAVFQNPFNSVIGGLPLYPGEEVAAVSIGESGALVVATCIARPRLAQSFWEQQVALTANTNNTDNNNNPDNTSKPSSAPSPGQQQNSSTTVPSLSVMGGDNNNQQQQQTSSSPNKNNNDNNNKPPPINIQLNYGGSSAFPSSFTNAQQHSGNCGRLLIYSSVPPTASQVASSGQAAPRRSGISKLLAPLSSKNMNQQPDFAVFLPPKFICGGVEISADEEFISVSSASSGILTSAAISFLKEKDNESHLLFKRLRPQVLVYRKIQPQDAFAAAAPSSSNITPGVVSTSARHFQIPANCATSLVFVGSISPPVHAMQSSSVLPTSVTPICHFLFRPVESRYAHSITTSFPMVTHSILVAWRGYNCFTTASLQLHPLEFGSMEVMKGSAHDYSAFAAAAINNATVLTNMHLNYQQQQNQSMNNTKQNQQQQHGGGIFSVKLVPPLPPLIPRINCFTSTINKKEFGSTDLFDLAQQDCTPFTGDHGNAADGDNTINETAGASQQQQSSSSPDSTDPVNNFINDNLLYSPTAASSALITHRVLPHIITTTCLCPRTSRVAFGLAEGVVAVWSHGEPPCFSTIAVAAPHRADAARPSRRPMICTSVSFFRCSHLVAALSVPVQIKPVDDLPSVHYSRVVVADLASGNITATVPHIPNLSIATTIGDNLPLIAIFGASRTFWIANIYTGELMAEIPTLSQAMTPYIVNTLATPQTVSGDHLMHFCYNLSKSFFSCPVTGVLFILCGDTNAGEKRNLKIVSSSSSSNLAATRNATLRSTTALQQQHAATSLAPSSSFSASLLRLDGIAISACLRPMLSKRDDIVRARRSIHDISYLLDCSLPGSPFLMMNNNEVEFASLATKSSHHHQKKNLNSATAVSTKSLNKLNNSSMATQQHPGNSSIGVASTMKSVGASNFLSASQFGSTTANSVMMFGGGGGSLHHQPPSNEMVTIPIADISRKMQSGKADRAKKVNKLLDDLLSFGGNSRTGGGTSIIGK